jgi:succinate dehydrogenase flavin-adding protein (antitoxin of CptAB toxin-antitoxin module)
MSSNKEIYGQKIDFNSSNTRTVLKADSIVDSIVDKFIDRSRVGKEKYGVTLDREDWSLDQWIEAAIEEHMDAILYLQKIRSVIGGKKLQ